MIDGYTRSCRSVEAVALFRRMMAEAVDPSEITVLAVVPAVSNIGRILLGEALHGYCEKKGLLVLDIRVGNSLIDLKYGEVEMGQRAMKKILDIERESGSDFVVVSNMLTELGRFGDAERARKLVDEGSVVKIEAPTTYLWNIILRGLAQSDAPEDAVAFYKKARGKDIFVSNSLIHLYAACGDLCCARSVFDGMLVKDVVSWNSLICGYSRCNRLKEALKLFRLMHDEG
ncbi:hypothetical protein ZWY2020_028375 [Hordeum vulgare]|nr:hypothetical protein ZWY2020_028375 [Hordeum vulgare]